jgi:iron complex transport system ATP-binding protein
VSIRVRNLAFDYKDFRLRVADLGFERSRLTAIVGPNGAGKTTFLKCLGSLLPISAGAVMVDDRDLVRFKNRERARRIGFVPQEHGSVFNYTVLDFVLLGRAAHLSVFATPAADDERLAREALNYVGLEAFAERPIAQLSSGERRLALIARALAQATEILLMDEPTTFLDMKHEVEILELVRRLAREAGKTVVCTLHNLDMALKYADAMVFMKAGAVLAAGPPDAVLSEALLEKVYDIPIRIRAVDGRRVLLR